MATILIVDDKPLNRDVLLSVLHHTGHTLIEAGNGAEALGMAQAHRPDVVIADILMPKMDGYEFVNELRSDPTTASTAVIFYTANYLEEEVHRLADRWGVVHVLTKPAEPAAILRAVEAALASEPPAATPQPDERFHHDHLALLNDKLLAHVEVLEHVNEERLRLLSRLVDAQEEERRRIAADIHDDSIQAMTAAGMRMEMAARKIDDPQLRDEMDTVSENVRRAITRLRHLVFQLRPVALDRDGIGAALESYLAQDSVEAGYRYRVESSLTHEPASEVRVILYRVAQEAFTNVVRHARASTITVGLDESDGGYRVRIADDGVGFDPESVDHDRSRVGHIGIQAMRERVSMAGGWCKVNSGPGAGTVVEYWLPGLAAGTEDHERATA